MTAPPGLEGLKGHYRSGVDVLARDFFALCLNQAILYRRAAGYFSSTALLTWASALPGIIEGSDLRIRLIASPELSPQDIVVLNEVADPIKRAEHQQMLADRLLEQVSAMLDDPTALDPRAQLFAWLLATERLQIRFAFPDHVDGAGIFHEKIGVFDFADGQQAAFTGSANETLGGHTRNYESLDVYRSWAPGEAERVSIKVDQFDEAWSGNAAGLAVRRTSQDVLSRLKARAPSSRPTTVAKSSTAPAKEDPKWRHQTEAVDAFLAKRAGVLEMATGTGKTRTTLKILERLIVSGEIDGAVIAMDGTDLLDQWSLELDAWILKSGKDWLLYRHFERHREIGDFILDPQRGILVVSRGQLHKLMNRLPAEKRRKMIVVHDEVHGLGTPSLVASLRGEHPKFGWRLGLSATPDRAYDQEGNDFLASEIGETIFRFPLELAIERGVLSGFDYTALEYELTDGDKLRLSAIRSKQAARAHQGNPMSQEEVWTEISRVYKTAEMKPEIFRDYLKDHPEILNNCIIFVETTDYGNALLEDIHQYTSRYRTYYADDERDHLVQFARGEIDCLITCHRVSQGIDIKALETVVLFASARARLETIQRIGRCLRSDPANPDKRAHVIDFVRPASPGDKTPNADQERFAWLTGLSDVQRKADA